MTRPERFAIAVSLAALSCIGEPDLSERSQAITNCPKNTDCTGDPGGGGGGTIPPPPAVSIPDFAMELALPVCDTSDNLATTVKQTIAQNFGGAAVEIQCVTVAGALRARVGLWLPPIVGPVRTNSAARNRGLALLDISRAGETAAALVPKVVIQNQAESIWHGMAKDIDHNGNPATGPTHLTDYRLDFDTTQTRTVVTVDGYDTDPVPDLNFSFTLTDTFGTAAGAVTCQSATAFHKDDQIVYWLESGAFFIASFISPWVTPVTFTLTLASTTQATIISSVTAPSVATSLCALASQFPGKFLLTAHPPFLSAGQKLVLSYSRASVDQGIGVGGAWIVEPRVATIAAAGTRYLDVDLAPGQTVGTVSLTALATAKTDDMIAPAITWTPQTGGTLGPPIQDMPDFKSRNITWQTANAHVGDQIQRTVSVSAVDAEGLTATSSTFFVFRVHASSETLPPVCATKPWLPDCQF